MQSRRVIFLSLLFPIIVAGLVITSPLYYHPLRRDNVPIGAYTIPWMTPNPSIAVLGSIATPLLPWNISSVIGNGLKLEINFRVVLPKETLIVTATIYLGHDSDYLYLGATFRGAWLDPTASAQAYGSDDFQILFDADNDGQLSYPEAASDLPTYICAPVNERAGYCQPYYNTAGWGRPNLSGAGDRAWQGNWEDASLSCPSPFNSAGGWTSEYNNNTGTLELLLARHLSVPNTCGNGIHMRSGERWVMGFLLQFGYSNTNASMPYTDFVDDWPRLAYPFPTNDASWWPKLVIDLTRPPLGY